MASARCVPIAWKPLRAVPLWCVDRGWLAWSVVTLVPPLPHAALFALQVLPPSDKPWSPKGLNDTKLVSFGVLTITPNALTWQQVVSADGSVQDTFTITKS